MKQNRHLRLNRGSALPITLFVLVLMAAAGACFVSSATLSLRTANREQYDIQTTHLCEAGVQSLLHDSWAEFKVDQNFFMLDQLCGGASASNPVMTQTGSIPRIGNYSAGVIGYSSPDNYTRQVIIRAVGWIDRNGDGVMEPSEPHRIVDISTTLALNRSKVFDYTYFVNNYGWMDGFGPSDLIINGDVRANGNFNFLHGSPTVNGSVFASNNEKLQPGAAGLINSPPVKWSNATYAAMAGSNGRWRQAYNPAVAGAIGSSEFLNNEAYVFNSDATMVNGVPFGATLSDATGSHSWDRPSLGAPVQESLLDQTPTSEVVMPDLSDITRYTKSSATYTDQKQFYGDGTPNPNYGVGAYVQTWNPSLNGGKGGYQTISTNGVLDGSAALIGTSRHPIRIHGPVTFTQDVVIKGYVSGQGTLYAGRNVHIVGSIVYANPPDFRGSDMNAIDNANEKADMLGLAASGSVIMGDVSQFTDSYPLQYMTPPFTKPRLDDNGNLIPAYDALGRDATGYMKYQSVLGNAFIHKISEPVNQIDAIMYTNFVGGGNIGTGGAGIRLNGSIISKDEAMVVYSLPMQMNYDNRIRERGIRKQPLIDISLPRSPSLLRSSWQDRGFFMGAH